MKQKDTESVTDFVTELKLLAAECEFDAFHDQALRDIFAIGIEYSSKPWCPQFFSFIDYVVRLTNNRKNITEVMKFHWPNLSSSYFFFFQ